MSEWNWWRPLLFVCALLVAPALTVWHGWTYARLVDDGVAATAAVTGRTRNYSNRSTSYYVEYAFRDFAGRRWSGSQRIDETIYAQLRVGQPIEIVYSRSNPDLSVAYMSVLREQVTFLSFVSLIIAIIAGGTAWWWHYALAKTREHDAAMGGMPSA